MRTPKKKETWDQIVASLGTKVHKSDLMTWFSRTYLKKLDSRVAVIDVPNKFVANWLSDNYLTELKRSFKRILKSSPSIHFTYQGPQQSQEAGGSPALLPSESVLKQKLNPLMTFQTLASGPFNRFALTSAQALADQPHDQYSLLYIYSEPGLGKTHLLHAIGNHRINKDPTCRVRYLSADGFTSEVTYAVNNDKLDALQGEYRNLDLLLLDDIHLLAYREKTQEEFLSIFNFLYGAKRQIVVTGNSPLEKMKHISSELRSRLGWGLLANIQPPDQAVKMDIIKAKVLETQVDIPDDVVFFLANSCGDIKSLIKNLIKLETYSSISEGLITISIVKGLTTDAEKDGIGLEDIMNTAAGYFNISLADLVSDNKKRIYAYPRQVAMYLARAHRGLSYKEIGRSFGNKDHSTVIYAIRRVQALRETEKKVANDLKIIESLLG